MGLGTGSGDGNQAGRDGRQRLPLARILGAGTIPARPTCWAGAATWRLHLQPTPEDWVDLALRSRLTDTAGAGRDLGWSATRSAADSLTGLPLRGASEKVEAPTPVLDPHAEGPGSQSRACIGGGRAAGYPKRPWAPIFGVRRRPHRLWRRGRDHGGTAVLRRQS